MKTFVIVSTLLVAAFAIPRNPYAETFQAWKVKHGKTYENEVEEMHRMGIFADNAEKVKQHNLEYELGLHTYYVGMNQFSDLTHEEFIATYLREHKAQEPVNVPDVPVGGVPDSIDWRSYGYVTPVKDQGQCGSCWSFSATGGLEGQFVQKNGTLYSFSEQQQVDCNNRCYGCDGGWQYQAYKFWETTAATLESDYPYTAKDGQCQGGKPQVTYVKSYTEPTSGSESALQNAVGTVGPVSVTIDASHWSFQTYAGGIYYEPSCSTWNLDHAVLAVGYGAESGQDYWLVKNSWGTSWGDAGYIYMSRNRNNNCGIATETVYPNL